MTTGQWKRGGVSLSLFGALDAAGENHDPSNGQFTSGAGGSGSHSELASKHRAAASFHADRASEAKGKSGEAHKDLAAKHEMLKQHHSEAGNKFAAAAEHHRNGRHDEAKAAAAAGHEHGAKANAAVIQGSKSPSSAHEAAKTIAAGYKPGNTEHNAKVENESVPLGNGKSIKRKNVNPVTRSLLGWNGKK